MEGEYPTLRSTFIPILWASILGGLGLIYLVTIVGRLIRAQHKAPSEGGEPAEEQGEEGKTVISKRILLWSTLAFGIMGHFLERLFLRLLFNFIDKSLNLMNQFRKVRLSEAHLWCRDPMMLDAWGYMLVMRIGALHSWITWMWL